MAGISVPGVGSNLDVQSLVQQLMAVERRPLELIETRKAALGAKISAYGQVKSALATFQSGIASLARTATFSAAKATSSDTSVFSASAGASAVPGSYSVEVSQLASAHKLRTAGFSGPDAAVGSGAITIQFGTYDAQTNSFAANGDKPAQTVTIGSGNGTLAGIRDAINAANAGVTATIVNDGSATGYRLVVTSRDSGAANSLKITVADDDGGNIDSAGLSQLAYDPAGTAGAGKNLAEAAAARDALVTIDGIQVQSASNRISTAIEGVGLTLAKTNVGSAATLGVERDTASVRTALEGFVKSFNDLDKTLRDLSAYNTTTRTGAALNGESTLRTLRSELRAIVAGTLPGAGGGLSSLSDVGIRFQRDGILTLDGATLDRVLADPSKDVSTLFAAVGKPSDSLVRFAGASAATVNGTYAVSLTQVAARGSATGSTAAATTIVAGVNDSLTLAVDGVSATVTLGAGAYSAASLAAEIQSRVNGAAALRNAGATIVVTESGGVLTLTSASFGAGSSVSITGGNAASDLLGTPTETTGTNVAGTIDGVAASGGGRWLTALSGNAAGLALDVFGGTTGNRGTVVFARGVAAQLDSLVSRVLDLDGAIAARAQGLDRSARSLDDQKARLERRLEDVEKRYRAQFIALDAMMSRMSETSAYLTQQLANLPKSGG